VVGNDIVKSATTWLVALLASLALLIGTIGTKPLLATLGSSRGATLALFILMIAVWLSWIMHKAMEIGHWKRVRSIRQLAISLTISLPMFLGVDFLVISTDFFDPVRSSQFEVPREWHSYSSIWYAIALCFPYSFLRA
jgi:membrane protease YdiL (CAAX protease family)